MLLAYKNKIK